MTEKEKLAKRILRSLPAELKNISIFVESENLQTSRFKTTKSILEEVTALHDGMVSAKTQGWTGLLPGSHSYMVCYTKKIISNKKVTEINSVHILQNTEYSCVVKAIESLY